MPSSPTKSRLDALLMDRGLCESREKAQRLIRAGQVRVNGEIQSKPGRDVPMDAAIEIQGGERFVSRGGAKLQAALDHFRIALTGCTAVDIGASTGGFTDAMLQAGAVRVYAFDVGKGQLAWKLRQDPRVVVREGINARNLVPGDVDEAVHFAAVDVSFISLTRILPAAFPLLEPGAGLVTLIKPQFEAGREQVGRGGVVRDSRIHDAVIERIKDFGSRETGLHWEGVIPSPLKGPAGNIEFLAYWKKPK